MKKIIKLITSIFICLGAGFIGSFANSNSLTSWYAGLEKPNFNPPNWIFAPVWTFLFILMGVSFFLVWNKKQDGKTKAFIIFFTHLFLNILWSYLFFWFQNPSLAFVEIIIFWFSIIATAFYFYRISKISGLLFLPYILWVSFASILNFYIVKLN